MPPSNETHPQPGSRPSGAAGAAPPVAGGHYRARRRRRAARSARGAPDASRHLHWSWAAAALALVLLARAALAGAAATLGIAALSAAVRGRRWHREDLEAGADLAEIAAERTTPLDGLRAGIHGVRSWLAGRGDVARLGVRRGSCAFCRGRLTAHRGWREASACGAAAS